VRLAGPRWYCVQTHVRGELTAIHGLTAQRFEIHLPKRWERDRHGGRIAAPLFPGYLFVRFDVAADRWRPVVSTRGVYRLFGATVERPTPLPVGVVEDLIERAGPSGIIDDGTVPDPVAPLQAGQLARVTSGPFVDMTGICTWSTGRRVRLLLTLLGGDVETELSRASVDAAA
jgi:transcriptional antiterminator RfaH